jgi:hypothetical protein
MSEARYTGSCQCGAVSYEVDVDLDETIVCNCSRCRRLGSVLAFAPRENFTLSGELADLTEFRFGKGAIRHLFCPTCGVQGFALSTFDGREMVGINANCLDGVDARTLPSKPIDGASF